MYEEYLEFAKQLAYEAGDIMRKYFRTVDRTWKEDATPLTLADTSINTLVIKRIGERFPNHSVLGEEESVMNGGKLTWVCDPVDGTMPFSHGLPIATFSLALCDEGSPIVGVVYDPFMDRLFWGSRGGGAFCNEEELSVNKIQLSENALIDIEGYEKSIIPFKRPLDIMLYERGAKSTHLWSAIISAVLVADGQFSGSIFCLNKPEDGAAISVIVREAGGIVTDIYGNEQRYDQPTNGFIASNGVIHDDLLNLIQEAI